MSHNLAKKLGIVFVVSVGFVLVFLLVVSNMQWYNAEDYRLKIPNGFHVSVDGETVLLYQVEEPVGGVTHYIESMTYDDLIILLQKGEEWESYSLESDHFSDKLLSFVNVDGEEYHHYIYRSLNDGIYDLWLNSGKISNAVETEIVEQFKLVA